MKPFNEFRNKDASFWAFIKFISETMGYTDRRCSTVKSYSEKEIRGLCQKHNINISDDTLSDALTYTQMRANLLNDFAEPMLMDAHSASEEYKKWEQLHRIGNYYCKLPLNKQKGEKKQIAFFTAIINILAEKTIYWFNE